MNVEDSRTNEIHSYGLDEVNRELFLHGYFSNEEEELGVEYRMATTFVKNLRILDLDSSKNILIHMHTIGGSWHDGMAIYNSIQFSKSHITTLAYASASSMSSVIIQAADLRVTMPDTEFLIHFGTLSLENHSLAAVSAVENEKRLNTRLLDIYTNRCISGEFFKKQYKSLTPDKVKSYIAKKLKSKVDWYLSAEEAVFYGFADGVIGEKGYENIDKIRPK
tara:strand:- start:2641 stop:3303 length:663 start_codon:yes stop_codon:yes gene_type:complete